VPRLKNRQLSRVEQLVLFVPGGSLAAAAAWLPKFRAPIAAFVPVLRFTEWCFCLATAEGSEMMPKG